jgi:serine/threonine protein kinase
LQELLERRKTLTEVEIQFYAKQIGNALLYLRSKRILHRDVKLANCLLDHSLSIKICDFGLSKVLDNIDDLTLTIVGTFTYMSPELHKKTQDFKGYSFDVDLWALGVCIFKLVTGFLPFTGSSPSEIKEQILGGLFECPENSMSSELEDLLKKVFVRQQKRISLD